MGALAKLFRPSTPDEPQWETAPPYSPPVRDAKIRVLQTIRASVNGFQVEEFKKRQSYSVTAALAESLISMGVAQKV